MVTPMLQGIGNDLYATLSHKDALKETAGNGTLDSALPQNPTATHAQQSGDTVTISEEARKLSEGPRDGNVTDGKDTEGGALTVARFQAEKTAELMTEMLPSEGRGMHRSDDAPAASDGLGVGNVALAKGANAKTPVQRHVGRYDAPGASMARIEEALSWFADTDAGSSGNTDAPAGGA
ncbi:hypothetical protein KL86DPRO_30104 [uncultured delta proteobacterium]|uniref:Uncharacterized protein n=1 Tax=uncultured delta proteobacterium TaxID=34034 RepID=A0A212K7J0_9DELT|nr:hypothetical protein KL86DPRO_30104 [uncultured delta proteobacterium]